MTVSASVLFLFDQGQGKPDGNLSAARLKNVQQPDRKIIPSQTMRQDNSKKGNPNDNKHSFLAPQNGEHLNTFGSVVGFNVVLIVTLKVRCNLSLKCLQGN